MQDSDLNLDNLKSMLKSKDESSRKLALDILKANSKKIPKKDLVRLYKLVPARECVKTYKDVCIQLGIKESTLEDYKSIPRKEQVRALATHKLDNICKRFNNRNVTVKSDRYLPYFNKEAAGWRFILSVGAASSSDGVVGFYFKNKEDSNYCGETFIDIYSELLG